MTKFDLIPLQYELAELALQGPSALLPALHAAQALYGYLPEPVAAEIGRLLGVPLADIYGVISFYDFFHSVPVGKKVVRVCTDPACAMVGGEQVLESVCRYLQVQPGVATGDGAYTVERASCLGLCEHAPAALVGESEVTKADPAKVEEILLSDTPHPIGHIGGDLRLLTGNCGRGRVTSLQEYQSGGGYCAMQKALKMSRQAVIEEVKSSGLVGRGGAAFPVGIKWQGVASASSELKYVVCNGDESEPGTFKDRVMMEEDPQRIIEGMLIAAYAVGAQRGYIYIRGEYPAAFNSMKHALQDTRQAGFLSLPVSKDGIVFDIELRRGAGAYICGEETALFESIEGKRGFPRLKPPFPTTHGLFGKPTLINNVETLCNVPFIIEAGAAAYRKLGTDKSTGTKLFCVSGDVVYPGLYEAPFGINMRHLLFNLAGGLRENRRLQAILIGGAAGVFALPDQMDILLSFEHLKAAGLPLGSGAVMAIDETHDLRDVLLRLGRFFAHESCGKCYPCQMGTQRQYEILQRVAVGQPLADDAKSLSDIGWTMSDASICGLGQTAATAVLSALKLWPGWFSP